MKPFMDSDFLLGNDTAKHLYHDIAKGLAIYDYHCHLDPKEIYEDRTYQNLTELWLGGDHYKWRLMRWCGVDEKYITGDAPDREKFRAFAGIMADIIGNPVYHWAHLELKRYFGIDTPLTPNTADMIYDAVKSKLASGGYSARKLIKMSNVKMVCTTDDPKDTLEYHKKLKDDASFSVMVLPTFRPDKALNINADGFKEYILSLDGAITDLDSLLGVLFERADYFASVGCRLCDHSFTDVPYAECTYEQADEIFKARMAGGKVSDAQAEAYQTYVFLRLCEKYLELDWAVQIHIGALRNNNTAAFHKLGPDSGFDSPNDEAIAKKLSRLLDSMQKGGAMPKVILYNLNPIGNYVLATAAGNFSGAGQRGRVQFGTAWWFADHIDGMRRQLKDLAALGALGTFVGMLTDSRSFTSYTRHEYFRRILCDLIGGWVENGEYPNDEQALSHIVRAICCENIKGYLGL